MPSFASGLLVLLAFATALSTSDETTCASMVAIDSDEGLYSNLDFFSCLIDGDSLHISWNKPEAVPDEVGIEYQVEYQCYNESLAQNATAINYEANTVVKGEASGSEFMGNVTEPKSNLSCLVTGCYELLDIRGPPEFYWIKEDDCTSTQVPASSMDLATISTVTTSGAVLLTPSGNTALPFHSESASLSEHSTTGGLMFSFAPAAFSVISPSAAAGTPVPIGASTPEAVTISLSSVVVVLVTMAIVAVASMWLFQRRKRSRRLERKEEEAEIVRLSMKNREIFSVSLGELSVIFTPYQSLESICIQSFEEPPHHVITVKQEKRTNNSTTDKAHDLPQKEVIDAFSPEKADFSSFTSDEGYIYQGPPPLYDASPTQSLAVRLDCAAEENGNAVDEVQSSVLCQRMSQSENSLDQGYITSEYAGTQVPAVEDFVFNPA